MQPVWNMFQVGVLSADPRRASQSRGVGGRRWVVRRDLVAEAPRYGSSQNSPCGCDGWLRIREDLAALSPTHQQRPRPARCVCTAPTGGPGAVKGDGASAHRLQRRGGRDGGITESSAGGSTSIMEATVWNPDGAPCVSAESLGPPASCHVATPRFRALAGASDLVFSGQTFQTLRRVTANLGLAVTSAGCTGPYAAPGR